MSKTWTQSELEAASEAMKRMGFMSFKEFCEALDAIEQNKQNEDDCQIARHFLNDLFDGNAQICKKEDEDK